MGEIFETLRDLQIDDNTLVVFTSDNGAHSKFGGTNKPLRGFKGSTWEGGMREPCLMWWPNQIPAGATCSELAVTFDLLPTFARLAGTNAPRDRIIDGRDIWPLMSGRTGAKSPHEAFYYYQIDQLQALRSRRWKLHLPLGEKKKNWGEPDLDVPLQLYDLEADISESRNVADEHPEVVERLMRLAETAIADLGTDDVAATNMRPAATVASPKPLLLSKD
jgi:arylsulfatase A-like enzyme